MSEPIRMLHFADIHIGMENYGRLDPSTGTSSRVRDFLDRLDEVIDYALEHEADLAVFAGDAFKNRDPNPTQQREFAQRIKRLAEAMPTLLLVGNHDMPGMASKASSVDIFRALKVPGVTVGYKPESKVFQTRHGPVFVAWMPYPMRNRLLAREEHQGKSIEELQIALGEAVSTILQAQAHEASTRDMPRLLVGHFSVAEAKYGSERSVMLGKDVALLSSSLADTNWDYVALGHIHAHQALNPGGYPPLVYSGSLERIDFGEEHEQKGFCWVELVRGATIWRFVPVAARPFHTIRVDARRESDPTASILAAVGQIPAEGAIVRLQVQLRSDQQTAIRTKEIEAALPAAASLSITHEIEAEARSRLGVLAVERLTPLELVEQYFKARHETEARLQELLIKAEELLHDSH